jgi:chemotaxis signal transduction protein
VPVDKVDKVIKLREMDIDPVRAEGHTVLSGVGKYQGTLVSLINVEKLLSL